MAMACSRTGKVYMIAIAEAQYHRLLVLLSYLMMTPSYLHNHSYTADNIARKGARGMVS